MPTNIPLAKAYVKRTGKNTSMEKGKGNKEKL